MDSIYALTSTTVEVTLPPGLADGRYTVDVLLTDPTTSTIAQAIALPLVVHRLSGAIPAVAVAPTGQLNGLFLFVAIAAALTVGCVVVAAILRVRRHRSRPVTRAARIRHVVELAVLVAAVATFGASAAWAVWSFASVPGGAGSAKATSVAAGVTPTVTASGSSMIVRWTASTLGTGQAVTGYIVKRYSAGLQAQTVLGNCAGVIANTGCIENGVPAGSWTYTVTPVFATNWAGAESASSSAQTSSGLPSGNNIWMWVTP
jgi:hypothetical protein